MITEGARLLRAHLKATDTTLPEFEAKSGVSRQKIERALNGKWVRIDIDFATAVEKASDGAVPIPSWSSETLRPAAPDELGRIHPRHRRDADEGDETVVDRSGEFSQVAGGR